MRAAAKEHGWNLNYGDIALMWRGGCIIRAAFLGKIKEAFDDEPRPDQPAARPVLPGQGRDRAQDAWRRVVATAVRTGIPVPAIATALAYLRRLPQPTACRPTCSRPSATTSAPTPTSASDKPRGQFFHTNWTGHGGTTSASTYTV